MFENYLLELETVDGLMINVEDKYIENFDILLEKDVDDDYEFEIMDGIKIKRKEINKARLVRY